jgi:hypothetical protein
MGRLLSAAASKKLIIFSSAATSHNDEFKQKKIIYKIISYTSYAPSSLFTTTELIKPRSKSIAQRYVLNSFTSHSIFAVVI